MRSFNEKINREAITYRQIGSTDDLGIVSIRRWLEEDSPWHPYLNLQFAEGISNKHRVAHARLVGDIRCRKAIASERRGFYNLHPELRGALSDPVIGKIFRRHVLPMHSYRHRLCLAMRFLAPAVASARRNETNIYFHHFDFSQEGWYERKKEARFRLSTAVAIVDQSTICKGMKSAMVFLLKNQRELAYGTFHSEGLNWINHWLEKADAGRVGTTTDPTLTTRQMKLASKEELENARRQSCSVQLEYLIKHIQIDQ